ncbi:MAG: response regulator [Desulfobacula sp.]|nr:response regulator [Desulfobacula sp.]
MKKFLLILVLLILSATPGFARDFIVEFMEENYRETQAQFSYDPLIYHSMQVNSGVGPKLLILTGNNYNYRKWLRHYIALNKKFITKVPENKIDEFVSSKAFEIDVTSLHPVNMEKWEKKGFKGEKSSTVHGDDHILIVDPNEKRTDLIQVIAQKMGYPATIFKSGKKALESFNLQPEKFSMVIVHHTVEGILLDEFVNKALKISHTIPVVVDTGYKDQAMKNRVISQFSNSNSVYIRPVILKDLQKTIESLIKKNV